MFAVRSRRIVRDRPADLTVVRGRLAEDDTALPEDVERLFADQRRYWSALRAGGAVDSATEAACIRREIEGG